MKDNDTLQFLQPLIKSIHMESEEYQNKGEKKNDLRTIRKLKPALG